MSEPLTLESAGLASAVVRNLPALQVVLPLLAAPVCLLLRRRTLTRILAILVAAAGLAVAVSLLSQVLGGEPISYTFGGWQPPWGIEYRVDLTNAFVLVLVNLIALVVLSYGSGRAGLALSDDRHYLYHALFLLCLAGLSGMAVTGDMFNIFVFLEISSLASYALISQGRHRRSLSAAFSYLIMGTIGGTFLLIGIGLAYQMTGTLNIADLAARLPQVSGSRTVLVAFAFLTVGISIKLAVFPLHQWLPNAYTYAPAAVSAFLAATATKVSYYVLVRVVFTVFGAAFVFGRLHLELLLIPLSVSAMVVGSLAAIYQTNIKRLLAYSSIAQVGYMTLGLAMNSVTGLTGGLVHMFNHGLMKGGLFLAVATAGLCVGSAALEDYRGLGRRLPWTMAAFVVGGLGLIGIPGTVGFISKWYLVLAALEKGRWGLVLAFLILGSSLLAVIYVWRVVEIVYSQGSDDPGSEPAPAGAKRFETWRMVIPTWILIGASLYFGLHTQLTAGIAHRAAAQLLGVSPGGTW